jgi:ribosomal protein S18 acetylase RimI-like enzyme
MVSILVRQNQLHIQVNLIAYNLIQNINKKENSNLMTYRQGDINDLEQLKQLVLTSWQQYQHELTEENWRRLFTSLSSNETYLPLLETSYCLICENRNKEIIGMAFLVPSGYPTEIYEKEWSSIRFVSVHPDFSGQGIGQQLTKRCIEVARKNNEKTIALHTSEMMHKARHIYESLGFTILRELEPRLGKKYWLYLLDLTT